MQILQSNPRRPLDLLTIGGGGRIAAACSTIGVPGHVDVWEVSSNDAKHRPLVSAREARSLALTPDGRFLFVAETRNTALFDLDAPDPESPLIGTECALGYPMLSMSADGFRLALTESRDITSRLTLFSIGKPPNIQSPWPQCEAYWLVEPAHHSWVKFPAINADGTRVAVVNTGNVPRGELIEIHDPTNEVPVRIPSSALKPVQQLAFTADSTNLVARTSSSIVKIFDATTGKAVGKLTHPGKSPVTGMAVHPNGTVACNRNNGTVCLWNLEKRALVRTLDWKLGKLVSVAFSPDGNIGAAGTEDGQVVVWDVDE